MRGWLRKMLPSEQAQNDVCEGRGKVEFAKNKHGSTRNLRYMAYQMVVIVISVNISIM
jgi:t-SNARE complex subunit (syntaxin)